MKKNRFTTWFLFFIKILIVMNMTNIALASSNIEQGDAALKSRDVAKAIQHYQIELKNNPKSIVARTKLARCYMRKGYKSATTKMITEAIALDLNNIDVLLLKSKLHLWNKQSDKAMETLEQIKVLEPDNVEALGQLAGIYNDEGNTDAADALYLKIKALKVSD